MNISLKKKLYLFGIGSLPLSIVFAWAFSFIPNPRPFDRGIGGGTYNGMYYWEHIKWNVSNQTRPDFCWYARSWGDSGPFPISCYKINQDDSSWKIQCSVSRKAFSRMNMTTHIPKIEGTSAIVPLPCFISSPSSYHNLNQDRILNWKPGPGKQGIDIDKLKRFYGDEDLLTIEKIQDDLHEIYKPVLIFVGIALSLISVTVGIVEIIILGLKRVFKLMR